MAEERAQRRLAAILAADVVGYSRMVQADEAGTLAALKSHRTEILQPLIAKYQGRIVKLMGDGVLVEFGSAVNAVACAVELQEKMAVADGRSPEDRRIALRVGVNVGDVVVEDGDLYGDGVNIAARLQQTAEPGNVWITRAVYDQVAKKLNLPYDDIGLRKFKNMEQPVHVFRIGSRRPHIDGIGNWSGPAKPSVAVLPFANMSGDSEQRYFSDGITEDVITELSRFHELSIIARNSSFQYRDKSLDVKRIAADLDVRFIVEGSVRRSADNIRVTAQLIDARTGGHLWADRFDRPMLDVFSIEDEVIQAIVANIAGQLKIADLEHVRRKPPASLAAYDCYLRGMEHRYNQDLEETKKASSWFEKALALDPNYPAALAQLALAEARFSASNVLEENANERFDRAVALANRAVALDPTDSSTHAILGNVHLYGLSHHRGSHAIAAQEIDLALKLNPNDPDNMVRRAILYIYAGDPDAALPLLSKAIQLNPILPNSYLCHLGSALYGLRRYDEAAHSLERITSAAYWDHYTLAACYAQSGRMSDARANILKAREIAPYLTLSHVASRQWYTRPADLEHLLDGLRKAGLPE